MSQVVSRSRSGSNEFDSRREPLWRRTMSIIFHGTAASTYGFAICFQAVSESSAQLYLRSNPAMRVFTKWRFLTYNCLVMQFVAYSLCFTSHFVPKLKKPGDFFFTTFAFPVGMLVVTSFWSIWVVAGREYIFPVALEMYYPSWLNHVTHTIIAPINLAELISFRHHYTKDSKSVKPLVGYILSYTSYLLYIRYHTGRFVYPFLNKMDAAPVGAFIVGMAVYAVVMYKSGKVINDLVHGIKSVKDYYTGGNPKKH